MSLSEGPGKSFIEMLLLTLKNHRQPSPFTARLMMAIFWEESLFTNRSQIGGGRGVGFGQVERQNFYWLKQESARKGGYYVEGVHSGVTQLNDDRSVQVASCYLLYLHKHPDAQKSPDKVMWALKAYGGVKAADGTPLTSEERLAIINRWRDCERSLADVPFSEADIAFSLDPVQRIEDRIIAALKLAKVFDENALVKRIVNGTAQNVPIRQLLFPRYWAFPPFDKVALSTFLPPGSYLQQGSQGGQVKLLQKMLNAQLVPPTPLLEADGYFGPLTRAAVTGFQGRVGLAADGVAGPDTRAALV